LDDAFAAIGQAFSALPGAALHGDERLGEAYEGPARLRLVTGEAAGSDRLAIARWRAAGLGEVHVIYPFSGGKHPLTDRPDCAVADDLRRRPGKTGHWTGLDAVELGIEHEGRDELAQWIVRWTEVLVALWDGAPARRRGGTGDTVLRALNRGAPVVWLAPGGGLRLIRPGVLAHHPSPSAEVATAGSEPLDVPLLTELLIRLAAPPGRDDERRKDPEIAGRRDFARVDPLRHAGGLTGVLDDWFEKTAWRTHRVITQGAGLSRSRVEAERAAPPKSLQDQPGFLYITLARDEAAQRSQRLSDVHRSEQLLLVALSVLAVVIGASPGLFQASRLDRASHVIAAMIELVLGGVAVMTVLIAKRSHRHRRWSDARRLAERLRAARLCWPLGVDVGSSDAGPARSWTEWRARAVLRAAGPRSGWLDRTALAEAYEWGVSELVEDQLAYHVGEQRVAENMDRRIRLLEQGSFVLLMAVLSLFLFASALGYAREHWLGGVVLVFSAVAPAVAAAGLTLDAVNGYSETALRSGRALREFEVLEEDSRCARRPSLRHAQALAIKAAHLVVADADAWREHVSHQPIRRA
jgi:hypothetical protein